MATKDEIIAVHHSVNQRLAAMTPAILANADKSLTTGTWTVRDALCHLAARSNGVPAFIARLERLAQTSPQPTAMPAAMNIDNVNQSQIDARVGRSAEELVQEIADGHLAAIEATKALSDDTLGRMVPNFRGDGESLASDTLLRSAGFHDNVHLDDIEAALKA